ncbi:SGNH/GDSL hydrolase family protein [Parvularcula sp. LCG005]|uniref:SGNH/GDSL hydrolase family protein n=1 Tax=Parvularcula sp. LCG005 TaxID=3078805 RepID=UPI002942FC5D|nr:GDSL-type esterase/lipase family protein [Parvularcula sp. LCG005]WOI54456.1 GDSL-type esterase/lipase family protein [Parvularcula sp. LCG005]
MRFSISMAALIAAGSLTTGCVVIVDNDDETIVDGTRLATAQPTDRLPENTAMLGRYGTTDAGAVVIGWPASGFAFDFKGTEMTMTAEDGGKSIFDVIIDGQVQELRLDAGRHTYTIFKSASPARKRIEIRRRTEAFDSGPTTVIGIEAEGTVYPMDAPARKILFIGDSITAGYGTTGPDETCHYSVDTASPQQAYAVQTAQQLESDYHLVAISGRGAVYNYGNGQAPNMLANLNLGVPDNFDHYWAPTRYVPDVVVINLGTNDFSTWDPQHSFVNNYEALLYSVHAQYPEAEIVSAVGPMVSGAPDSKAVMGVKAAISRFEKAGGQADYVYLPWAKSGHVYGCDWHPGPDTARTMADTIAPVIARAAGWSIRD